MLTITDIYDALTATDRPYKPAVRISDALDMLGEQAKAGQLDAELLQTFVEAKIWEG